MNKRNIAGAGVIMVLMAIPATLTALENEWGKSDRMSKRLGVEQTSWQKVARESQTPEQVCSAVRARVQYARERVDRWKSGQETWESGQGDCEDFALCVRDACGENGMEATLYVFASPNDRMKSHAVTMGEWNGRKWMSSNGSYQEVRSLDEAREIIANQCGWRASDIQVSKIRETVPDYAQKDQSDTGPRRWAQLALPVEKI